jgi:hypothetical protein
MEAEQRGSRLASLGQEKEKTGRSLRLSPEFW